MANWLRHWSATLRWQGYLLFNSVSEGNILSWETQYSRGFVPALLAAIAAACFDTSFLTPQFLFCEQALFFGA